MRTPTTLFASLGAGLLLAVATPLAAAAHVTITPDSAEPGGYTTLTVRVPNESETESTVRLDLRLPSDTPIGSVRYVPMPGWTTETEREQFDPAVEAGGTEIAEAVTSISWTAEPGFEIGDGEFQEFTVSLGPVPDIDSLVLKADQHYSDGSVVSWSETGEDAEHPAPVLYVNAEAPAGHHGDATDGTDADTAGTETPAAASDTAPASSPDVLARVLGIAGLVAGAIGIAFGITARRRPASD
ncbi:YcnI family protein [Lysobacter korlensis]|uniref:YcnI family protein n=1 Tax=Lysobacter korlensis TaxID=553636 RepID=A0ABV6RN12_9GAMM